MHEQDAPQNSMTEAGAATEEEMPPEQRAAMDRALEKRRKGGTRQASIDELTSVGIEPGAADVMIDGFDELMGILHGMHPDDVSEKVAATLAEKVPVEKRRKPLTKPVQQLVDEATRMSARGKSKADVAAYLNNNGASQEEANKLAAKVSMDVAAARAKFDEAKQKAMNSAMWKIGLGAVILVVGLVLMASGAESSGRRTPLGAVVAAVFMIGAGVKDLTNAQDQSFERRIQQVLR